MIATTKTIEIVFGTHSIGYFAMYCKVDYGMSFNAPGCCGFVVG
jgi:hypothetical protein